MGAEEKFARWFLSSPVPRAAWICISPGFKITTWEPESIGAITKSPVRVHPLWVCCSRKNKGAARVGRFSLLYSIRAESITNPNAAV